MNNIYYRIGILNDFKNTYAFSEYKTYGELKIWNSCLIKTNHKGYQESTDNICLFLNFNKVYESIYKEQILIKLKQLIENSPETLETQDLYNAL